MRNLLHSLAFILLFCFTSSLVVADVPHRSAEALNYIHPDTGKRRLEIKSSTDAFPMPYHNGTTLVCSMCHVMHASEQHSLTSGSADAFGSYPRESVPNKNLLRKADAVALCIACHDGNVGIPDVVGADINGLTDRSAGQFELPSVANPRGHKLDYGLSQDDWELCTRCHFGGQMPTAAVSCIDCHNPHGNHKARNLQWASWPGGEPDFGLFVSPAATGMSRYEAANIGYGTGNNDALREVTNMCNDCHHVYTGSGYNDPSNEGIHSLHPSYDSERDDVNYVGQGDGTGTTDGAHWNDGLGAGFVGTARLRFVKTTATNYANSHEIDAATNGVFCLSCHKAHGGDNAFGLRWDPSSGPGGKGCEQCHNRTAY